MRALTPLRYSLLALGLVLSLACSADEPNSPTAPPANPVPVPTPVQVNFTVTASRGELVVNGTNPSIVTIRAVRADTGQPVTGVVNVTTTLGGLGSVGGPQAVELTLVGGVATVPFFPGGTIGTASISASLPGVGTRFVNINVREEILETFFITSISPGSGSPQGGETVTILGGGFSGPIRVTFGSLPAEVISSSGTQIRVRTPPCSFDGANACFSAGAATPVAVSVTINLNEEDEDSDTLVNGFVYQGTGGGGTLQPTVFSVTPASGPNEGGTQVTINGDGFEAPVQVKFGTGTSDANFNGAEAQVISVTRTRVVVLAPPTSCGGCAPPTPNQLVNILVKNQNTSRFTVATSAFRYGSQVTITSIAPGQGSIYGGDFVTIFGLGFDSPVAVDFGGIEQQPVSVSGSEVVVRTTHPTICPAGGLQVHLVNIETGNGSSSAPSFTYLKPNIFSLNPTSGGQAGGTALTIGGANFGLPIIVDFSANGASRAGNVTNATTTSINVTTPSMPDSAFDEISCNDNGDEQEGRRFIPFLYTPSNTTCRDDIAPPP
jgi:hypothetical protein